MWRPIEEFPIRDVPELLGVRALLWHSEEGMHTGKVWRLPRDLGGKITATAPGFMGVRWEKWWDFGRDQGLPPGPDDPQITLEPVAVRHSFDGHGWLYMDSGSGSDWLARAMSFPDAEPLFEKD